MSASVEETGVALPRDLDTKQIRSAARAVEAWLSAGGGTGEIPDWPGLELAFMAKGLPAREAVAAVCEWFRVIKREHAKAPCGLNLICYPPTPSDAAHSALLARLLSGSPALDEPPPTAFGCPWYAVVEKPGPHRCLVGGALNLAAAVDGTVGADPCITVNQALWTVVEELGENEMLVRWRGRGPTYRLCRDDSGDDEARLFPWTIVRI